MATSQLPDLLTQAGFILDSCGRQNPPAGQSWVDIPAHIGYSRYMPPGSPGTEDIGGVMHPGKVPFMLRGVTAQALPRESQGLYWRMRFADNRYFQAKDSNHSMSFGFGSDRQVFSLEGVEWGPGEKLYVDLDTILAGPPPAAGITAVFMFEGVYRFPISGKGAVTHPLGYDLPRYFVGENQNILAPEFRFGPGCPSETPAGYEDEEFCYVSRTIDLPITGAPISNTALQIEPTTDFVCRQIWPNFPVGLANQGTGAVTIRMTRGDGYALSSNFLPILGIQGAVFPELMIRKGDSLYFDTQLVDGAGAPGNVVTFGLYLYGVKRRKVTG